jgi:hypothetical protein
LRFFSLPHFWHFIMLFLLSGTRERSGQAGASTLTVWQLPHHATGDLSLYLARSVCL